MVTFFFTSMVVFMMFSSKRVVLRAYTMKTIPAIKTDRSAQKSGAGATHAIAFNL
jgi:hypothetical protein